MLQLQKPNFSYLADWFQDLFVDCRIFMLLYFMLGAPACQQNPAVLLPEKKSHRSIRVSYVLIEILF